MASIRGRIGGSMVGMTQSFSKWLWDNHREIYALVSFGHTELITEDMHKKYIEFLKEKYNNIKKSSQDKNEKVDKILEHINSL